jgi:translocator protein
MVTTRPLRVPALPPVWSFVIPFVAVLATALIGGIGAQDAPAFYAQLRLPRWAPPASVFGPVWTALYIAMAVAAWLVARSGQEHRGALVLFGLQLIPNAAWSLLFFEWKSGWLAFADIVLLAVLLALTVRAFWRAKPLAAVLLLPYLGWVLFATALTWAAWQGNPGLLS